MSQESASSPELADAGVWGLSCAWNGHSSLSRACRTKLPLDGAASGAKDVLWYARIAQDVPGPAWLLQSLHALAGAVGHCPRHSTGRWCIKGRWCCKVKLCRHAPTCNTWSSDRLTCVSSTADKVLHVWRVWAKHIICLRHQASTFVRTQCLPSIGHCCNMPCGSNAGFQRMLAQALNLGLEICKSTVSLQGTEQREGDGPRRESCTL